MYELRLILFIGVIFACFFALKDPIERLVAVALMLGGATIYNIYAFIALDQIDIYWIAANTILIIYFFVRFRKGDFTKSNES